ncbi:MAG TPA: D-alanyl-D-alanine carboxypeptidase/D-alanyl-D-alanine-endopeptidase [Vicinamibacterales bacterium]|nr:D-alanyl-D-alanine carboxypeptidase/D-alanyl-D-alanine-endopeptidase [Vicinamibacterales bacterium]
MTLRHLPYALAVLLASGCAGRNAPATRPPDVPRTAAPAAAKPGSHVTALRRDLTAVFSAPIMERGSWAVDVRSLDTGEEIYALDAQRLMMPASNMKILTTAAAAEVLGWNYRFATALETSAPIEAGVLKGDLFIRGTGDPTINSREGRALAILAEWTTALRALGIVQIDGRIVGDDQAFDDEGIGQGWAWDYLQFGYAAPVGALEFNENMAALVVRPGAQPGESAQATLSAGAGLRVVSRVRTVAAGAEAAIGYRRRLDEPVLEVSGTIAAGAPAEERTVAVVNPTLFFAQSVKDALIARGVAVAGDAVDIDDIAAELATQPAARRVLASTTSPTLAAIATVLMKVSQNLYAETLVKTVGAARGGLGTFEGGSAAIRSTLASWGIPDDGYVIADGSGLSRYNYVTASTLTTVLERMYKDAKHRDAFMATLPVAGKDGTVTGRMRRTRAEGNAAAKTGSISNVRALSGYVRTRDGEMLVFSILANDFVIPSATVTWIADLAVEHLANFTRR